MTNEARVKMLIEKAGSMSALAGWAGVTRQAVSNWRKVPAERVLKIEKASGISRHKIRPDIYGAIP